MQVTRRPGHLFQRHRLTHSAGPWWPGSCWALLEAGIRVQSATSFQSAVPTWGLQCLLLLLCRDLRGRQTDGILIFRFTPQMLAVVDPCVGGRGSVTQAITHAPTPGQGLHWQEMSQEPVLGLEPRHLNS